MSRRELLRRASNGFGTLALGALLARTSGPTALAAAAASGGTPAVPVPHHRPSARSVIFLFMEGAVSQVDSFDHKPLLEKYHGQDARKAMGRIEKTQFDSIGKILKSPWNFRQHGQSGLWISDLFPHIARQADDLCVLRSMTSTFPEHTSANYFLHSGIGLQGRPSMGAWVNYGLGSLNDNLPGYVVLNGGQIPSGGLDNFGSGFLPATHQGSLLQAHGTPLANVVPSEKQARLQQTKQQLVRRLNDHGLQQAGAVDALESAIRNYELAARMQVTIPELMDLSNETAATRALYGVDAPYEHTRTYARECILARRMVERGVRFVELTIPMVDGYSRWDAHGGLVKNHGDNARAVDQPIAGLLIDLKQRGLLDDTILLWTTEFGRMPCAQGGKGRDHNPFVFTNWLCGGGIRGGITHGESDQWGYKPADRSNVTEVYDIHATILHLLGIDHTRLTFRHNGVDRRLTDVHGEVIRPILA